MRLDVERTGWHMQFPFWLHFHSFTYCPLSYTAQPSSETWVEVSLTLWLLHSTLQESQPPCRWCQGLPSTWATAKCHWIMAAEVSECLGSWTMWEKSQGTNSLGSSSVAGGQKVFFSHESFSFVPVKPFMGGALLISEMPLSHLFYCPDTKHLLTF